MVCREDQDDFITTLRKNRHRIRGGMIHSFMGDLKLMKQIVALDIYIVVNAHSMKTSEGV